MLCQVLVQGMSWEEIQLHKMFFFNQSESIVDYLTVKIQIITIKTYLLKPLHMEGSYGIRYFDGNTWMHETTFDAPHPYYSVTCWEYVCDCMSCLQFKFHECFKEQDTADVDFTEDLEKFGDGKCGKVLDQNQQIFDFVDVSLFVSLFKGNPAEPLYLVKVAEKGTDMTKDMNDPYGYFIQTGELFFKRSNLKLTRSSSLKKKIFQILLTCVLFPLTMYLILT